MALYCDAIGLVATRIGDLVDILRFTAASRTFRNAGHSCIFSIVSERGAPARIIRRFKRANRLKVPRLSVSSTDEALETASFLIRNGLPRLPILRGTGIQSPRILDGNWTLRDAIMLAVEARRSDVIATLAEFAPLPAYVDQIEFPDIVARDADRGNCAPWPPDYMWWEDFVLKAAEVGGLDFLDSCLAFFSVKRRGFEGRHAFGYARDELASDIVMRAAEKGHADIVRRYVDLLIWEPDMAEAAAEGGNLDIFRLFLEKGYGAGGAEAAAFAGHRGVIEFLVAAGERPDWDGIMKIAAHGGHEDIIDLCVENGADDWDGGLSNAVFSGKLGVVEYFYRRGGKVRDFFLKSAARRGDRALLSFLFGVCGDTHMYKNFALRDASVFGNIEAIDFLIEKGAGRLEEALLAAVINQEWRSIAFLVERGAGGYNGALVAGARLHSIELIEYFISIGADDFEGALRAVAASKSTLPYLHLIDLLVRRGARDFNNAIAGAVAGGDIERIRYISAHAQRCAKNGTAHVRINWAHAIHLAQTLHTDLGGGPDEARSADSEIIAILRQESGKYGPM